MPVQGNLSLNDGTRPYKRHLTTKYIQYLRKFVQTPAAQETTHWCDSGIGVILVNSPVQEVSIGGSSFHKLLPVCLLAHRAELPDPEVSPTPSNPHFSIEDGALRGKNNRSCDQESRNHRDRNHDERTKDINPTLHVKVAPRIYMRPSWLGRRFGMFNFRNECGSFERHPRIVILRLDLSLELSHWTSLENDRLKCKSSECEAAKQKAQRHSFVLFSAVLFDSNEWRGLSTSR